MNITFPINDSRLTEGSDGIDRKVPLLSRHFARLLRTILTEAAVWMAGAVENQADLARRFRAGR